MAKDPPLIHSDAHTTRTAHGAQRPTTRADEERRDCLREMSAGPIRKPPGRIDRPGHSHQRPRTFPGRGQLGGGAIEVGNAAHSPTRLTRSPTRRNRPGTPLAIHTASTPRAYTAPPHTAHKGLPSSPLPRGAGRQPLPPPCAAHRTGLRHGAATDRGRMQGPEFRMGSGTPLNTQQREADASLPERLRLGTRCEPRTPPQ